MNMVPNPLIWFIIEDDLDDQEIFMIAAKKVNPFIECTFANDGVLALEKITNDPSFNPGTIFLDVNMPRMNGVECLAALRNMDRLKNVPIFMCSTSSDAKIMAKISELGAQDFIVKPSTISAFAQSLAEVNKKINA